MRNISGQFQHIHQQASMLLTLIIDAWRFLVQCLRPAPALAAENLFLGKQLALYEERQVHPRQATNVTRIAMVWLSYCFDWRSALRIVTPETFTCWHRQGFRLLWRWKSKPGQSHMSLGPGSPSPPPVSMLVTHRQHRHQLPPDSRVVAEPILGGLHYEYRLKRRAA